MKKFSKREPLPTSSLFVDAAGDHDHNLTNMMYSDDANATGYPQLMQMATRVRQREAFESWFFESSIRKQRRYSSWVTSLSYLTLPKARLSCLSRRDRSSAWSHGDG